MFPSERHRALARQTVALGAPAPRALCGIALVALLSGGCAPSEPPVGAVSAEPGALRLGFGQATDLELLWMPTAELAAEGLRVAVHVRDSTGELIRTFDHPLPAAWTPGEERRYAVTLYQSAISPALPPGRYPVDVGLYDSLGNRWPLDAPEGAASFTYTVAEIDVPDRPEAVPAIAFSAGWLGAEAGTDRQILARRWLSDGGAIRVSDVEEPGTLWVRLATPTGTLDNHTLVLGEGEVQPAVVLTSDCDDRTERLAADEVRELRLEVTGDCAIELVPNYYWEEAETSVRRSLALEGIAWMPS